MTPPAARQPGEGAAHRISERDILRALQYGPERLAEHKPLELWNYELPGMVAWINSLLAAEYQRGVEDVVGEAERRANKAHCRWEAADDRLTEIASKETRDELRGVVAFGRALITGPEVQR